MGYEFQMCLHPTEVKVSGFGSQVAFLYDTCAVLVAAWYPVSSSFPGFSLQPLLFSSCQATGSEIERGVMEMGTWHTPPPAYLIDRASDYKSEMTSVEKKKKKMTSRWKTDWKWTESVAQSVADNCVWESLSKTHSRSATKCFSRCGDHQVTFQDCAIWEGQMT